MKQQATRLSPPPFFHPSSTARFFFIAISIVSASTRTICCQTKRMGQNKLQSNRRPSSPK